MIVQEKQGSARGGGWGSRNASASADRLLGNALKYFLMARTYGAIRAEQKGWVFVQEAHDTQEQHETLSAIVNREYYDTASQ